MTRYRLSERAERDLFEIFVYTVEQFGLRQAKTYRNSLSDCFALLADNPRIGRKAEAVGAGLRRHEHRSHVIFYEEAPDGVRIVSVIHGRRIPRLPLE